jgi:hypothetical protein
VENLKTNWLFPVLQILLLGKYLVIIRINLPEEVLSFLNLELPGTSFCTCFVLKILLFTIGFIRVVHIPKQSVP